MAALRKMPKVQIDHAALREWGKTWRSTVANQPKTKASSRSRRQAATEPAPESSEVVATPLPPTKTKQADSFDRKQAMDFGYVFDKAFGDALAVMLGNIPVVTPKGSLLIPPMPDCVEVGLTRIVGAIRPQNYDAAYRPDGPRIVYDSKTLNERKSLGKNWQNMVNDLTAEGSTVHIRFPMCIVAFIVAVPRPALPPAQERDIIRTLERLGSRENELDQHNLAEAVAFVVWDPDTGIIDPNVPKPGSNLRLETLNERVEAAYLDRYKNLPPHQEMDYEEDEEAAGAEEIPA